MSGPMRYRKKPVEVQAMQLDETAETADVVRRWIGLHNCAPNTTAMRDGCVVIRTLEGDMLGAPGDYVIRGVRGEFYPCKPDIFEATYEPVAAAVEGEPLPAAAPTEANDD